MSTSKCQVCGKPLSPTSGDIGATCKAHAGILRSHADIVDKVPENWIRMSKVCQAAVEQGITISAVVNAAGGDAATKPVIDPVFRVAYVGRGKFMNPEVLTKGFAILKAKAVAKDAPKTSPKPESAKAEVTGKLQQVVKS